MKFLKLASLSLLLFSLIGVNTVYAAQNNQQNGRHAIMKFNHFAYIFLGPNLEPLKNHTSIKTNNFTFEAFGIDFHHKDQVIEVAKKAVANGAQVIELCGGFGPVWIAKISEAINNQVPVGSVFYGPEARKPMLDLLTKK